MIITKTTASAVSRALSSLNYERIDTYGVVGYQVIDGNEYARITIINKGFNHGQPDSLIADLENKGYVVTLTGQHASHENPSILVTIAEVFGKVGA
jgi:hypothetical protein